MSTHRVAGKSRTIICELLNLAFQILNNVLLFRGIIKTQMSKLYLEFVFVILSFPSSISASTGCLHHLWHCVYILDC